MEVFPEAATRSHKLMMPPISNYFAGVMIDRFGKDVSMLRLDDKSFVVNVEVAVSRQFLAWIIGLGEGVTLAGPDSVVEMMNAEIDRLIKQYKYDN